MVMFLPVLLLICSAFEVKSESHKVSLLDVNKILYRPFAPTHPLQVSAACRQDGQDYLNELAIMTPWALNMYDATAKMPSGILTGNNQLLGNFDQCLQIHANVEGRRAIRGKYCTPRIQFSTRENNATQTTKMVMSSLRVTWAICVPTSCTSLDVATSLRHWFNTSESATSLQVEVKLLEKQCVSREDQLQLKPADIAIICTLVLLAVLMTASTIFDVVVYQRKQTRFSLFVAFSLYSNGKRLKKTNENDDFISCLNGLRFLSMCWIVFDHTFYMLAVNPLLNSSEVLEFRSDWTKMVVMNGTLPTDTFFLITGILLCNTFMRDVRKKQTFNIGKFYMHRYLRLTPAYALVIFYYSTLLVYMGSGPLWNQWVGTNSENCQINWWTNLIYVNNYVDISRPCLDHTWYLAVDMQLFWLSPLILYPLWRWPKLGMFMLAAVLSASLLASFIVTYTKQLPGAMLYFSGGSGVADVFTLIYVRAYTRAGPYAIGIALGYLLVDTKSKHADISKLYVFLGWIISMTCCLAALYGVYGMYQQDHVYDVMEASFYAALHRSAWALGVAWIVFACVRGYGGVMNTILSWRQLLPLGRLTYAAYLCHFMVIIYNAGTMRTPMNISNYELTRSFLSNLVIVFALSAGIYLTVELPFLNLERIITQKLNYLKNAKIEHAEPSKYDTMITKMNTYNVTNDMATMKDIAIITCSNTETYLQRSKSMDSGYEMYDWYQQSITNGK